MFLCISHLNLREGNHAQISTILSLCSNFLIFAVFFCPLTVSLQLLNPRHKSSSRKNLAGCAILFNKDTFYSNVGVNVDLVMEISMVPRGGLAEETTSELWTKLLRKVLCLRHGVAPHCVVLDPFRRIWQTSSDFSNHWVLTLCRKFLSMVHCPSE